MFFLSFVDSSKVLQASPSSIRGSAREQRRDIQTDRSARGVGASDLGIPPWQREEDRDKTPPSSSSSRGSVRQKESAWSAIFLFSSQGRALLFFWLMPRRGRFPFKTTEGEKKLFLTSFFFPRLRAVTTTRIVVFFSKQAFHLLLSFTSSCVCAREGGCRNFRFKVSTPSLGFSLDLSVVLPCVRVLCNFYRSLF